MTQSLTTFTPAMPASSSIASYLNWANSVPMLSAEDEYQLAKRLRDENDLEAAKALILPHIRYVARIARDFMGYGLAYADLVQEGTIGLMKAVKRFDPDMGVRLASYAVHWIKSEMHEFIIRNWRIVKIATTKSQRKLFFNLRKQKKRLGWQTEAEVQAVAKDLNVSPNDVRTMEMRLANFDESFDGPMDTPEELSRAPAHTLANKSANPETQLTIIDTKNRQLEALRNALAKLDERSRDILKQRWLTESKATLQDLSKQFNISIERVRQLEKMAMAKVKEVMAN